MVKKLSIVLLVFLSACMSPQKTLQRTWRIDDVVFLDSLNTLPEQQKKMLTYNLKKNLQFTFLRDSAYQVHSGSEIVNGKWWLSSDKKSLFTTTQQGTVESKIYELKKKQFQFESAGELNQSFLFTCSPVTDKK
jgi:hypothetical protein